MSRMENQTLRRSKRIQQNTQHPEEKQKNNKKLQLEENTQYFNQSFQLSDGRVHIARVKQVTVHSVPVEASAAASEETKKNRSILTNKSNRKASQRSTRSQNKKQKQRRTTNNKNTPAASSRIKTPVVQLSKVTEVPYEDIAQSYCNAMQLSGDMPAANTLMAFNCNGNDQCSHRRVCYPQHQEYVNHICDNNAQTISNCHLVNTNQTQTMPQVSNIDKSHTPGHMPQKHQIQSTISRQLFPPRPNSSCPQSSCSIPNPSIHPRGNINSRLPTPIHSQTTSRPMQYVSVCCNCINTCRNIHQVNQPLPNRGQIDLGSLPFTHNLHQANTVQHFVHYVNPPISNSLVGSEYHHFFQNKESSNNNVLPSDKRQGIPAQATATPQVLNYNKPASQSTQQQQSNSRGETKQHTVFFPFQGTAPIEIEIK